MAKKSAVFLTSAIGVAAVAAGVYASRKRRARSTGATRVTESKPIATVEGARRFASDWRGGDDRLTEEHVNVVEDQTAAAL